MCPVSPPPSCYELNTAPPKCIYPNSNTSMTLFVDRAPMELIKVKWGHKKRKRLQSSLFLSEHTEKRLYEGTVRKYLSANQEERSHQKATLPAPWSWLQVPKRWENKFLSFKWSSLCILLWQTKQTKALPILALSLQRLEFLTASSPPLWGQSHWQNAAINLCLTLGLANYFCKGPDSILNFCRPHGVCHHHSTLPLQCESHYRWYLNSEWDCSDKILFIDTDI